MVVGIMKRNGARQSSRYTGVVFPTLGEVMFVVNEKCEKLLADIQKGLCVKENADFIQKCTLVSAQVLMPPIRGKPFWSLCLKDSGHNSVSKMKCYCHYPLLSHRHTAESGRTL